MQNSSETPKGKREGLKNLGINVKMILKMDLKETGCEDVGLIRLEQ